ncbi:MAG: hypothetical protein ACXW3Z_13980, partial [Limisphaerales bacterium]
SLLEPAINKPVCPVWIRYETDEGSVGRDVAYWGDAVFALQFQPENGAKWPRSALNTPLPTACSQAVSPWIYDDMNTMRVLKDGCEVERPVEKVLHSERTLYGGCPERRTIHIPRLEPGESLIFRGKVVFIRTLTIPG